MATTNTTRETRTQFIDRRVSEGATHQQAEREASARGLIYGPGEYIPTAWDASGKPCAYQSWERMMSE